METGKDWFKLLENKKIDNDADKKTLREILQSIGKTDLARKLDKYLAIGQYFCKS